MIENGLLTGVPYRAARLIGGVIRPEIVILHDTAGRLTKGNSAAYLRTQTSVSVHFVIERDGTVEQQVPVNRRAGHAGRSSYHGRAGCNDFSIGIEIVNPGRLSPVGGGRGRAWFGEVFGPDDGVEHAETPEHGTGLWMPYTLEQIGAVLSLCETLFRTVDTLRDITTHWYVSPGRKIDTNPLFPLEHIRALVLGRDDPADDAAEAGSEPVSPGVDGLAVVVHTAGDSLNLRRWPSFNPNVVGRVPHGTVLQVERSGTFGGRLWHRVHYGGVEGWIVASYTRRANTHA